MTSTSSPSVTERFSLDPTVRRLDRGRRIVGGSPLRVLTLSDAGAEFLDRITGAPAESTRPSGAAGRLLRRLLDAGIVHPEPELRDPQAACDGVTVVVPVRDRTAELAVLLASLAAMDPAPARHVVVVDDGSLDARGVADVAAAAGARVVRRERSGGPAAARNAGLAVVETELVAFVDSDCSVSPDWLVPLRAQLGDPEVALVAPRVRSTERPDGDALARYEAYRSPLDLGPLPAPVRPGDRVAYVPSAALLGRAAALRTIGGFDESLRVGEDVDLVWRLLAQEHRVRYDPRSVVWHAPRPTLRSWLVQRVAYGSSAAALERRHPGSVAPAAMSRWSLGLCLAAVALPRPLGAVVATGVAGVSTSLLRRRLPDLPATGVARLVLGGHLGAGRQLATATTRVWWPAAVAASLTSRRARRIVGFAVGARAGGIAIELRRDGAPVDPTSIGLGLLDDVAYGAGVWRGCVRQRSFRALVPRITK